MVETCRIVLSARQSTDASGAQAPVCRTSVPPPRLFRHSEGDTRYHPAIKTVDAAGAGSPTDHNGASADVRHDSPEARRRLPDGPECRPFGFGSHQTPTLRDLPRRLSSPCGSGALGQWRAGTDPQELGFASVDTHAPHVVEYAGENRDKTAHYMLR